MFGNKKDETKIDSEIFSIYDSKVQAYGAPIFATNQHDIVRQLTNMFRDPEQQTKNQLFLNAEDFSVFKIGSYEKSTGKLFPQNPEHVANMHDLRALIQQDSKRQNPAQALFPT